MRMRSGATIGLRVMIRNVTAGFLVVAGGIANSALAATIDCRKAQSRVEKTICADAELTELDEHLNRYYNAAKAAAEGAEACLQTDQVQWLKSVRDPCKDNACLKTAYLNRLGELTRCNPASRRFETSRCHACLRWCGLFRRRSIRSPPHRTRRRSHSM